MLFYYHYNLIHFYRLKKALPRHGNIPAMSMNYISAAFKNNLFCIISTSCILNIYLFIYSVLADVKSDIIFRNLANYFNFTVSICVIAEPWS